MADAVVSGEGGGTGEEGRKMITITKDLKGNSLAMVGVVEGRIVQTLDSGQETGELKNEAEKKMIEEAEKLGADAIVCVRYSTAPADDGATEVMASGTAVKYTSSL